MKSGVSRAQLHVSVKPFSNSVTGAMIYYYAGQEDLVHCDMHVMQSTCIYVAVQCSVHIDVSGSFQPVLSHRV